MEIRTLSKNETDDALSLIAEAYFRRTGNTYDLSGRKQTAGGELTYLGLFEQALEAVLVFDPSDMRVSGIAVRVPEREGQDAAALLEYLKQEAVKAGFDRISAQASSQDIKYYRAAGFETDGQTCECFLGGAFLGKKVTVTIEHHTGDLHEIFPDEQYGCCTGYVEDLVPLGIFRNAYVIADDVPADSFSGIVIAVIYRRDGTSLWAVSEGVIYSREEVIERIAFNEQYYETSLMWL